MSLSVTRTLSRGHFAGDLTEHSQLAIALEKAQAAEEALGTTNASLFAQFCLEAVPRFEASTAASEIAHEFNKYRASSAKRLLLEALRLRKSSLFGIPASPLRMLASAVALQHAWFLSKLAPIPGAKHIWRLCLMAVVAAASLLVLHLTITGGIVWLLQHVFAGG